MATNNEVPADISACKTPLSDNSVSTQVNIRSSEYYIEDITEMIDDSTRIVRNIELWKLFFRNHHAPNKMFSGGRMLKYLVAIATIIFS